MNRVFAAHLERLKTSLNNVFSLSQLADWITKNTYLDSRKFSFKNHEFQRDVISDAALTSIVVKCAQVGLSEIMARWTLAAVTTQDNFTAIYTFPTTSDAEKFCRTRIDPCISASPLLAQAINNSLNNSELKQFNGNSFIYFRGTMSETAALSVPADVIIHDEVDKSNLTQMSVYVSRLQHKPTKMRKLFSTPTVSRYGISKEAETARRYRQVMTCSCCGHKFLPDYFANVHIPGFDGDKREITKSTLKNVAWEQARLLCPKCGRVPEPGPEYMEWVCENPGEAYPANAWFITPFSAPSVITAPYLVKTSTEYDKYSEFVNQSLGLTAEDEENSITVQDLDKAIVHADLRSSDLHYLGADMGLTCHITIGRMTSNDELVVVHRESVTYTRFEERRRELCAQYRVVLSVHDAQPYTDMITRITEADSNAYGSYFVTGSNVMFNVKKQDEEREEAKLTLRKVNISRTPAFDHLMYLLKQGLIKVQASDIDEEWKKQIQSLKRISKMDRLGEHQYVWEKTDGNDHYHFSLLYLVIASKMRGLAGGFHPAAAVPLLSRFKLKQA